MPRWGLSRSDYFYDKEKNIIAKGLASVKYIGSGVAEELYNMSHDKLYDRFMDVLIDINEKTSINTRQLEVLISLDFFVNFGNQRELLRIKDMFYDVFKRGNVKKINKEKVDGTQLEPIIKKYSIGVTKSGQFSKSYTVLDVKSILHEVEDAIKAVGMDDLDDLTKVQNFVDVMGYPGYVSGKEEDRPKLYVMDVYTLCRKKDKKQFGYSVITKSIGSGKESRFTVFNSVYYKEPINKGNIILCKGFRREGAYFTLTNYIRLF